MAEWRSASYHATDMWLGVLAMNHLSGDSGVHYAFCIRLANRGLLEQVELRHEPCEYWFKIPEGMTAAQVRDAALVLFT